MTATVKKKGNNLYLVFPSEVKEEHPWFQPGNTVFLTYKNNVLTIEESKKIPKSKNKV